MASPNPMQSESKDSQVGEQDRSIVAKLASETRLSAGRDEVAEYLENACRGALAVTFPTTHEGVKADTWEQWIEMVLRAAPTETLQAVIERGRMTGLTMVSMVAALSKLQQQEMKLMDDLESMKEYETPLAKKRLKLEYKMKMENKLEPNMIPSKLGIKRKPIYGYRAAVTRNKLDNIFYNPTTYGTQEEYGEQPYVDENGRLVFNDAENERLWRENSAGIATETTVMQPKLNGANISWELSEFRNATANVSTLGRPESEQQVEEWLARITKILIQRGIPRIEWSTFMGTKLVGAALEAWNEIKGPYCGCPVDHIKKIRNVWGIVAKPYLESERGYAIVREAIGVERCISVKVALDNMAKLVEKVEIHGIFNTEWRQSIPDGVLIHALSIRLPVDKANSLKAKRGPRGQTYAEYKKQIEQL